MDLKEAQISELKNINLIYVFATDSIFKKGSNKYVGAKVVFEKNKMLSLNYQDEHFEKFIKRILDRYHKEKDKRKIILLGELTKKLINDSSFAILEKTTKKGTQTEGIPSFNTSHENIKKAEPFLKDVITSLLMVYKNYEVVNVDKIDGFNKKYMVEYSIGPVKKMMPMIISQRENGIIDFKIKIIDDVLAPITGSLKSDGGKTEISWQNEDEDLQGTLLYDAQNDVVERKITSNGQTIVYDESKDTLLEEDASLIKFYFDLCELPIPSHIIKVNDTTFLLSDENNLNDEEDEILYNSIGAQINIGKDEVRISYRVKNCFSKYNNQINAVLDEECEEFTFKKVDLESRRAILVETKTRSNGSEAFYNYQVYEVDNDVDLRQSFEFTKAYRVNEELKTLEKAKQYIKEQKGGK